MHRPADSEAFLIAPRIEKKVTMVDSSEILAAVLAVALEMAATEA